MTEDFILHSNLSDSDKTDIKVSVVLITYNHEKYITQALESVLIQKTNFNFEILIVEDYSTDNTRNIIIDFQKRYPGRIKLILSEKNNNDNKAWIETIQNAKGRYIALLDGDDYWTSSEKLQLQSDFLEDHRQFSICFHNVQVIYTDKSIKPHPYYIPKPIYRISNRMPLQTSTLKNLIPGNFIQTCSVMFRAGLLNSIPNWFIDFPIGDWPLHILNAEHGHIFYFDEILGTYRVHSGGLWSANMSLYRKFEDVEKVIYMFRTINKHLNYNYDNEITEGINPLYFDAMQILFAEKKYKEAMHYAKMYFSGLPLHRKVRQKELFIAILKAYLSKTIDFFKRKLNFQLM